MSEGFVLRTPIEKTSLIFGGNDEVHLSLSFVSALYVKADDAKPIIPRGVMHDRAAFAF